MTDPTTQQLDLDAIQARADAATDGPWSRYTEYGPQFYANVTGPYLQGVGDLNFGVGDQADADEEFVKHAVEDVRALVAEIHRLRTDAAAELLPAWEAMYEPGNVSDYLIGYANSEAGAKGAAEAWMRSQAEVTGRLEWVPQNPLSGYDTELELIERHDDGVDTGPGITIRHRAARPTPAV